MLHDPKKNQMEKKENLKVVVEVKGTNYSNGKLKSVFGGKAQIIKDTKDRDSKNDVDTISFRGTDCTPKIEAEYKSVSIGKGEVKTDVEIELRGQLADSKNELLDAIAGSAKLTKADAGRNLDTAIEDIHKVVVTKSCDADCASIESTYETKTVEIIK